MNGDLEESAADTAHRVRIYEQGSPDVLRYEEFSVGEPGAGEVRLRQEAIGLNFVNTMFRDGTYPVSFPFDMGVEGVGVVEAVGPEVEGFQVGDRVGYFFGPGSYADRRLIGAESLLKIPDGVGSVEAAAIIAKGMTAWMLLRQAHRLRAGETVLITAAAGGVGSLLTRWAQHLGAKVIAAVGNAEKAEVVRRRGVEHVVSTDDPDLLSKIREISGGGVDVVFELTGKDTFERSVAALRDGGVLVHGGSASGYPDVDQAALDARAIRYAEPRLPETVPAGTAVQTEAGEELFAAFEAGVFGDLEITRYALTDAARAHEALGARRVVGSVVLIP